MSSQTLKIIHYFKLGLTNKPERLIQKEGIGPEHSTYVHRITESNKASLSQKIGRGIETSGDILCYHAARLPIKIVNSFKEPLVATVALTALAMIGIQFSFYPIITSQWIKRVAIYIAKHITLKMIRFILYILSMSAVLGLGTRAFGRFVNNEARIAFGIKPLRIKA